MQSRPGRDTKPASKSMRFTSLSNLILIILLSACNISFSPSTPAPSPYRAGILWDSWGVPHIYAKDDASLFYAFGHAQMESHADLLLRLYGQARGRAAEYWGENYLKSDEVIRTMGFPDRAQQWYDAQSPEFRRSIAAFVAGINDEAKEHPNQIAQDVKVVLPVQATDVFAHLQNVLFNFLLDNNICGSTVNSASSNAWAIAPSHSADGKAILLANPHLPWSGLFTLYEAQITAPDISAYGVTFVGLPVLSFAFNDDLSWAHTINTIDACNLYKLTLAGNGYLFDGLQRSFETKTQTLLIKQADGKQAAQRLVIRRSIQGPVIEENGETVALRVVGVDQFPAFGALQEWWDMARAKNLAEFEAILHRLQLPMFTVIYADRPGNILSFFGGEVPIRLDGDWNYWANVVPGNTSATLWTNIHPYLDLPKVVNPPSGWVQNSNSPPWETTFPQALDPNAYPPYMAPQFMSLREQNGVDMLMASQHISLTQVIHDKFSAHVALADRVLDDLITAASLSGDALANRAANVLRAWDRTTNATSRGAVLFYQWLQELHGSLYATPWEENTPLTTPAGLASPQGALVALDAAARKIQSQYGSLDVPWGNVFRMHVGNSDFPASGGPGDPFGIFRALYFTAGTGGRFNASDGDSYIAAVEFSQPMRAMVLTTYGNSSQPGSPHVGDQLALYSHNQLRPAWLTMLEIEAHLTSREVFQ